MPKIHIFFNGEGVVFPDRNDWEKFQELDAVRTFLICAESWRRAGWEPVRFSTVGAGVTFEAQKFLPAGRIAEQFKWYPAPMWQFIAKALDVATDPHGIYHFATMDVINHGFTPPAFFIPPCGCVTYQKEHFSMSFISCTRAWLLKAAAILNQYDAGELKEIPRDYISDESILREYAEFKLTPLQAFACDPMKQHFPLLHYARSTVAREYAAISTS